MVILKELMSKLEKNKNLYKAHILSQKDWCNVAILSKVSFKENPIAVPNSNGRGIIAKYSPNKGQKLAIIGVHLSSAGGDNSE